MKKFFKSLALIAVVAVGFASCEDVPAPYAPPTKPTKPTVDTIYVTCEEALAIVDKMSDGETSAELYAITGYITDVFSTISKGQQSFWFASTADGGKQIQAYWANLPEGVASFKLGSQVKVVGKLMRFVNTSGVLTPEMKNADVEILGGGDAPVDVVKKTCAEAAAIVAAMEDGATSAETYEITGYITDVFTNISRGQQTFWMADTKDGGKIIQAYWANLPEGVESFKKDAKVKITGKLLKYVKDGNVTPEVKNADVVILEEGGEQGGGGDQPGTPSGDGSEKSPYNVAGALAYITTLADGDKPAEHVYTKGVVKEVVKMGTSGSIQFKMQDKSVENELLVYYCDNLGKKPFTAATDLKAGDEVIVCGTVQNFKGNTPEYNSGSYLVSLNGKTEAEGGEQGGGEQGGGESSSTIENGGFESWSNGVPTGWQPTTSAGGATLSQSTDAHSGSYSVSVAGVASSNKRMGSKEIDLEAGTYEFAFYAKATDAEPCQVRPGYVPVTDGKVGSYAYGDYANLTTTGWTLVKHEFTLAAKTTVNLVLMNPKASSYHTSQAILVDDATLTKK